nr:MgtC/SapB family protein [Anoxybacter fermentans]
MLSEKDIFIRLIIAALLGGLIGWERELHDRPAGFRTHILVSIGSALIMIVSIGMYYSFEISGADPGRIAAQVVSGIGFLGAGTIIREGVNVKGLTTAASLWTAAGIGLAAGAGFYFSAFITTGLVFIVLMFLTKIEFKIRDKKMIEIRAIDRPGLLGDLGNRLGKYNVNIKNLSIANNSEDDLIRIHLQIITPPGINLHSLNEELLRVNGVSYVEWTK